MLKASEVYVTDGITKSLTIIQKSEPVTIKGKKANFHLEENDSGLRFYVPQNSHDREICLGSQLPKRLTAYMDVSDPKAGQMIIRILSSTNLSIVDEHLKEDGIIAVEGVERSASDISTSSLNPTVVDTPQHAKETTEKRGTEKGGLLSGVRAIVTAWKTTSMPKPSTRIPSESKVNGANAQGVYMQRQPFIPQVNKLMELLNHVTLAANNKPEQTAILPKFRGSASFKGWIPNSVLNSRKPTLLILAHGKETEMLE